MAKLVPCCFLVALFICTVQCTTTRYFTYEEDSPGTEIGNLSRDLKINPADGHDTSFRFMQENNSSVVHMREADGLLSVAELIDRELLCPDGSPRCFLTFDVVALSRDKYQLIHVEIEVRDINDHAPVFARNDTGLEIVENEPLDSRFPLPIAVDPDVGDNYIQSYNISPSSHFTVEMRQREDGVKIAELVLVRELDREMEDSYVVEVTATDGGVPAKSGSMTVRIKVLDFNDNGPTFEHGSLKVELNEDSPVGHRVVGVHAFDPDEGINGEVMYAFDSISPEAARVFHIDPHTGYVTLRARVDFERRRSYELLVKASDLGARPASSSCKISIEVLDVNDNAPEISIKPMTASADAVAYITEAAAAESFVALISTADRDSGSNGYVRVSLLGHEHFTLQQAYGETFMIVTTSTLDRERIPEYNLTVVAEDLGNPPFKTVRQYTIRVTDENDNPPLFSKSVYEVSVIENNIPGSYVTTVVARDPDVGKNAKVSYKLLDSEVPGGSPVSAYVSVDTQTGSLYTVRSFDYESIQEVELVIQAEDKGVPSLSSTSTIKIRVVDQNDNYPYFTFPVLFNDSADIPLPLNAPSSYLALRLSAEDMDEGVNGELSYHMLQGDHKLFTINKDTGEIALKQWLAARIGDTLELVVAVSDHGRSPLSSSATVRFVVTDTEPSEDQAVVFLHSGDDEEGLMAGLDGSLVVIIVLSGGCALLLVAIVAVAVKCRVGRNSGGVSKREARHSLFEGRPPMGSAHGNIYTGQRGFFLERTSSSLDDSCLYEERSSDSESKMFLPSKLFQTSAWQGDKYCLQVSGIGNTDQLSVKDSGKGDSDFNDSDSDISGDGGKRSFSTFHPKQKSSSSTANSLGGDCQGTYCAIPPQCFRTPRDLAYTSGFSPATLFNDLHRYTHSWKDSSYGTNPQKTRSAVQTFSGRTLPPYLPQVHNEPPIQKQSPNIVTVATELEVATMF
ncbi:protocadherin-8 [Dunckerocampus dactyliophorus]|uniref:protocadherin-8 n=1 Tax=Dunckerocampus dactyliophorus TaxID=161453 RepID=UPI00240643B1|nr:protocadherin-8 [Dunckerocampus dactyliophorus]